MNAQKTSTVTPVSGAHATMTSYTIGFVLCVLLTIVAYIMVQMHIDGSGLARSMLIPAVVVLAVVQFLVQLVFFLHFGRESKPRWKALTFVLALLFMGILVGGSLWIMYNLDYNMHMTPKEINTYMDSQDGL